MAKDPAKAKKTRARPKDPLAAVVDAALELAGSLGWRHTSMSDIAETAGIGLSELYRLAPSKAAVIAAIMARIDEAVLAGGETGLSSEPAKDRLFDVVMRRFDAMQPNRDGIRAITRDLPADPLTLVCLAGARRRSLNWMLEAAGLAADGVLGLARRKGLELILMSTLRVWIGDDSRDMSATMAHLDKQIARADKFVGMVRRPFDGRKDVDESAAA